MIRTCKNCRFAKVSYNEIIDEVHVECDYRFPHWVRQHAEKYMHPDDVCSAHKKRKKKKPVE